MGLIFNFGRVSEGSFTEELVKMSLLELGVVTLGEGGGGQRAIPVTLEVAATYQNQWLGRYVFCFLPPAVHSGLPVHVSSNFAVYVLHLPSSYNGKGYIL